MNRAFLLSILIMSSGLSAIAEEPVAVLDPVAAALSAIREGQLTQAEEQIYEIDNPVAKLFLEASLEVAKGHPVIAHTIVSQLIVRYPNNPDWTAKSELMSANLYIELGLLDEADVTARHVQLIYEGTEFAATAGKLRARIEKLKQESE